jgi:hypothetical protein
LKCPFHCLKIKLGVQRYKCFYLPQTFYGFFSKKLAGRLLHASFSCN